MAGFRSPGDHRSKARVRQVALGCLASAALVGLLSVAKRLIGVENLSPFILSLPIPKVPLDAVLSPGNSLTLAGMVALGVLFSFWAPIRAVEFHLFPWFDEETLRPIKAQTGLLAWVEAPDSPINANAKALRDWLNDKIHDGRWSLDWILRGQPALKETAFRYAVVVGPNGVGKSQFVK